ncbi:hypothetical protein AB0G74_23950 [Streptomyces sp. NPDC020875]|uniref:hypothetical protein n=1 Tax=Streptomyces sp. NPDC020875 TaxID=3154898 RepID=UPI0033E4CA2E
MKKRLLGTLLSAAFLGSIATAAPASAGPTGPTAVENFHVCYKNSDCNMGYTSGTIDWGPVFDFPPSIKGKVHNRVGSDYSTTVKIEYYQGPLLVHSDSRTVRDGSKTFEIGYTHTYVDRIKFKVCQNFSTGEQCGLPENYSRA